MKYGARALVTKLYNTYEIIACALLESGVLLKTRQFIGYKPIGTIHLNYMDMQVAELICCYVFVRSADGEKVSDSVWVEVKG